MEYVAPGSFEMTPFTFDTPVPNPFSPAGSYPKVWGNNQYIDYQTWDSYRTVYGQNIVNQAWGSGVLELNAGGSKSRTTIDPVTAEVKFEIEKKKTASAFSVLNRENTLKIFPNPFSNSFRIKNIGENIFVKMVDLQGKNVPLLVQNDLITPVGCNSGIYILRITNGQESQNFKVIKL